MTSTDSWCCLVPVSASFVLYVLVSCVFWSHSSGGWQVWQYRRLLWGFFGSKMNTQCKAQLLSPSHSPGRRPGPQVAPDTLPSQWGPKQRLDMRNLLMRPNDCPPDPRLTSCGKLWCTFANNNAVGNDNVIVEGKKRFYCCFITKTRN